MWAFVRRVPPFSGWGENAMSGYALTRPQRLHGSQRGHDDGRPAACDRDGPRWR